MSLTLKNKKAPRVRVGTLNIPLDPAKLPNGEFRAKVAAKQVHDSNLDILCCQEIDRTYPGDTWHYARIMLKALRKHDKRWKIVKPTTAFNENIIYYRSGRVSIVRKLSDIILPSTAGGRHATRATFSVEGKKVVVRNTHLVSGSSNSVSRLKQASRLLSFIGGSTIVMGDLNQVEVPKPLLSTHKSAKDHAKSRSNFKMGTYAKWGADRISNKTLDYIIVPKKWTVNGYNLVGVEGEVLTQPRASDHLLVIASLTVGK